MPSPRIIAAGLFLGLASLSCQSDKDPAKPDPNTPFPYAQPTTATMTMNLNDLAQGNLLDSSSQGIARGPVGVCHAVSALVVGWVNANVVLRLAVPMAAFDACGNAAPVYLGNDTWRWTASGGAGANAWTAELTGQVTGSNMIDWSMRVSGTPQQLDRFLWFEGTADTQAREGVWHFYDPASLSSPRELIRCEWSLPALPGAPKEVTFVNTEPGGQWLGDNLQYTLAETRASIAFLDASAQATTRVEWDQITGAGLTIGAQGDTCCWGARPLFPDVPCH